MKIKLITIILIMTLSPLMCSCGGINNDVKRAVESQSPGAEIISAEKAKSKLAGSEAWCITYQPKKGGVERMILAEGFQINNASGSDFAKLGCTD